MKKSNYLSTEFKQLFSKKSVLVSVAIVLLVPLVYAMIMLSAKWGPQDNIDNVPVAVVNDDLGANQEGETVHIGDELVENLKVNPTLGWDFVSSEQAEKGMDNMEYYMVIEVPEHFSEDALTVLDDNPKQPELKFTQNEGLHYMAAQVTDTAIETIKEQLSTQITETYVQTVVDELGGVGDGFSEAADGAGEINDGTEELKDGSDLMLTSLTDKVDDIDRLAKGSTELNEGTEELQSNLDEKSSDITELAEGSQELNEGANELSSGTGELKSGSSELKSGTDELKAGSGELKSGTDELKSGSADLQAGTGELESGSSELKSGTSELQSGANELKAGSDELKDGSTDLAIGADSAKEGIADLKAGLDDRLVPGSQDLAAGVEEAQAGVSDTLNQMEDLKEALEIVQSNHPELEEDFVFVALMQQLDEGLAESDEKIESFQDLADGANEIKNGLAESNEFYDGMSNLENGLGELASGASELDVGVSELSSGVRELQGGTNELDQGATQLAEGASELNTGAGDLVLGVGELDEGASDLVSGAGELNVGASELDAGASELNTGADELSSGAVQIADGNSQVRDGWTELQSGANELHDGSNQIKDGNIQVKDGWTELTDGTTQIDDGLLQVVDGSAELKEGLTDGAEQAGALDPQEANIAMFAQPVVLDGEVINSFPFYRDANAPYIVTLALFVGILAMSFVVPYRKPEVMPPSALSWFSTKVTKLAILAIAQALIVSLYSLFILKVEVHSNLLFILFSVWVSLTFLMIVLFLVALAGNVGRFIALAFAVVQLSTTGSDLPIHMLPEGLRSMSVFLPFTYSIDGFKNIITLGSTSNVLANAGILFIYFATFAILAGIVFFVHYRKLSQSTEYEEARESVV